MVVISEPQQAATYSFCGFLISLVGIRVGFLSYIHCGLKASISGAGKMAQVVICLLHRCKDLSPDPYSCKNLCVVAHI